MSKANRILQSVQQIHNAGLPDSLRKMALTMAFSSQVKYAGTTGISIQEWSQDQAVVTLKNRMRVQNHIRGVHATAMATLGESTTGMLFSLQVPDTHLPLLKSMKIEYNRLASGDLKAVATMTPEQQAEIRSTEKGSMVVPVTITDSKGQEPIQCEFVWAWTPKRSKL
eukprot:Nitzschia sp. Nitz4//scaffold185_size43419//38837//39340//NITZ4_007310-RA/size43419-processed-gene-0.85-mRNA-1//-1//CDS//3329539736//9136//frame0